MPSHTQRAALLILALLGATAARAQRGIDVETFRPALDGYGLFAVERAETSPQWDFGFKLAVDYAHAPLRLALKSKPGEANPATTNILDYQAAIHLGAHLGLTDWLELAFEVPVSAQHYAAAYGSVLDDATLKPTGFYLADG